MTKRRRQKTRTHKPIVTDSLQNLTAGLNTPRDKQYHARYVDGQYGQGQYETAYRNSWLARAIIDKRVDDSTRKWREWQATTDQIASIEDVENTFKIKMKINQALKQSGLYGGSALYFDLGDDPSEPLVLDRVRRGQLRFVTVIKMQDLQAGEIDNDPLSSNYGNPSYFKVHKNTGGEVEFHHSRLVFFKGVEVPNQFWGDSRLKPVFDTILQFESTAANIASLVYEAKVDVFSMNGLTQLVKDPANLEVILRRYELLATGKGNNGMMVIDGESESYDQKTITFAGLTDIQEKQQQNVCGAAGMPRAILFGISSGGLGSTGELELSSYYDTINAEQENVIQPAMELLDEVIIRTALGSRPEEIYYNWRSLWQMSDEKKAEIGLKQADTLVKLVDTGLFNQDVLSKAGVNMLTESGTIPGLESYENEDTGEDGEPLQEEVEAL